ncbi:efflux RND transporter periplasmic adaptor subunit [Botrimarina mediterranea]|uniref:Multidrug export protein AcrE n=1 Tax=Botrimarina mediterranea TaxID=2528022 RepID=A0A518K4V3_9BACT|nr:efflux RND transporter periplasmic adaptor subunit [Botrimarina mediterranea]QDV72823.1 Multidrug export protein AcrE precursor [Botrimarina mediterranea]
MTLPIRLAGPLAVAAAVLAVGCGSKPPGGPQANANAPVEVTVAKPLVLSTLDWDPYTGRLAPVDEVEVRARVSGYLESYHFEEGQFVDEGQLLFVIDQRPYQAAVDQAKALLEEAHSRHRQAEAQVREAEAGRQQVSARLELAQTQLNRAKPLVPRGAISEDAYDEYVAAARQAEADAAAADAAIESAKAAVNAAVASIATAEAALTAAELDLGYCRITAPIRGRVSRRMITKGNLVTGGLGAMPLTTIVSMDPIHVYFDCNEQALLKYIRLDQTTQRKSSRDVKTPAYMALIDEEGYPHKGYIDFVDNRVDRATGSMRARAIFANTDEELVPGVFVRLQIPGSEPGPRVLIPDSAVATDQAAKFVYIVGEGDKLERRPVTTGAISKDLRVITGGLDGSESVVVKGLQRCRPGAEVKVTVEEIVAGDDLGLPDTYEPVAPEEWLRPAMTPINTTPDAALTRAQKGAKAR